jgi:hypothetical protein
MVAAPTINYLTEAACPSLQICMDRCLSLPDCRGIVEEPFRLLMYDGPSTAVDVEYARCGTRQLPCAPSTVRVKLASISAGALVVWSTKATVSIVPPGPDNWVTLAVSDAQLAAAIALPEFVNKHAGAPAWALAVCLAVFTAVVLPGLTILSRLTHTTADVMHITL